jgi:sporulation protein YlmC with PRC-barrel domain
LEKNYLTKDKIIGKQVADTQAMIVGTVKDLSFDIVAKQIALTITTKNGKDINVESEAVNAIGDIVLLNNTISELTKPPAPPRSPVSSTVPKPSTSPSPEPAKKTASPEKPKSTKGQCTACGFQNELTNKFCIKCGSKI